MHTKKLRRLWGISLMTAGVSTLVIVGASMAGVALPDAVIRMLGAVGIISIPVIAYTTVKLYGKHTDQ